MCASTRRIRVNGVTLNVLVEGSGPDVLLVHGAPDDHTVWRRQIPALVAAGYRVIAPDTRGCGESDVPRRVRDYAIDVLVRDLAGVLDALGIGKARVVGHDWGALQSWHFAFRHPERVDRLIALSIGHPRAYGGGDVEQKLRSFYTVLMQARGIAEYVLRRFNWLPLRFLTRYPEEFPRWKERLSRPGRLTAVANYYRANPGMILPGRHPRARVPVTGAWSSGERFATEAQMRKSQDYCDAGWKYQRIDGPNHWMQLTGTDALNAVLLQHLR